MPVRLFGFLIVIVSLHVTAAGQSPVFLKAISQIKSCVNDQLLNIDKKATLDSNEFYEVVLSVKNKKIVASNIYCLNTARYYNEVSVAVAGCVQSSIISSGEITLLIIPVFLINELDDKTKDSRSKQVNQIYANFFPVPGKGKKIGNSFVTSPVIKVFGYYEGEIK